MSTATAYNLSDTLQGILQERSSSPRELVETLSFSLEIPYGEAEAELENFLGHEIPVLEIGSLLVDGLQIILNIPELGIYHTIQV